MKNPAQQPNEHLLNDVMSTSSLDGFYDDVESQLVARMTQSTPLPPAPTVNGSHKKWLGLGGTAAVLILVGTAVVYYGSDTGSPTVATDKTMPQERPAAVATNTTPPPAPTTTTRTAPATAVQSVGSTSVAKVTAQAQPSRTLSAQTQRDIDSLTTAMKTAASPSDAARIGYQLGLRYRIAGDNAKAIDMLISSSATAQKVGANVLAARGYQQAAKAALQLGDRTRATSLLGQALTVLPAAETTLRERWQQELDSLRQ